jgi:nucleoside-diphosphate-sugar epimerase
MANILVTGGAGYIGSHLVRKLLRKKHRVIVLDNLSYGKSGIEDILDNPNLQLVEGDICNIRDVVTSIKEVSCVIALAAIVGDPACELNHEETLNTNYQSTKILVEVAEYYKVPRIVFASSCSVYGANSQLVLNEGSRLNPVSLYAQTRIMSEQVLLSCCKSVVPVILRLATVFGLSKRMRFDLVVNILTAHATVERRMHIYGGNQWRPFVHVEDAAEAFIRSAELPAGTVGREIFNVGSNQLNHRISDLAQIVRKVIPKTKIQMKSEIEDSRDYRVNFDKIGDLMNYRASRSIGCAVAAISKFLNTSNVDYRDNIYYNVRYLYK